MYHFASEENGKTHTPIISLDLLLNNRTVLVKFLKGKIGESEKNISHHYFIKHIKEC